MTRSLILTLRLDQEHQAFFDGQREAYFPPERNFLAAHLTLFHHLKDEPRKVEAIEALQQKTFMLEVTGMKFLGAGVAYALESEVLLDLRKTLANQFWDELKPQDRQGFRPHITVQNKVSSVEARKLYETLKAGFESFQVEALGLDLWHYHEGPWEHYRYFPFQNALK
ncbi:2'-5' RNA ligase family protein [Pedobacter aquatilis]|uniref:2'-5' RNA ligase family protein n=1 Tax=Pedobacter aquatilis TaxID=351343 RepID=UPI0029303DD7|nr:2'-5' RNA ligase family protein [Pedobacter aquatilis]